MSTTTNATTMPLMMRRLLGGGGLRVARGRMVRTLSMRLVCQIRGGSVRAAVRCARVPSLPRRPRHGLDSTVRRWRHRQWYLQRYRWKCLRRDLLLSTMRLPASDRRGRRGGGLAVRGLVGAQHRGEALHHGGVELLGGHVAELLHRGAVVNHHLVAAANRLGSGHARDGAPAPPLGVPRAVPALVAVDEGVHGAAAHLVGPGVAVLAAAEDHLDLVLHGAAGLVHGESRDQPGGLGLVPVSYTHLRAH